LKLSKRDQASGTAPLKALGWEPEQLVGHLAASLGLVPSGTAISAAELLERLKAQPHRLRDLLKAIDS